jgi:hypothetical protein
MTQGAECVGENESMLDNANKMAKLAANLVVLHCLHLAAVERGNRHRDPPSLDRVLTEGPQRQTTLRTSRSRRPGAAGRQQLANSGGEQAA